MRLGNQIRRSEEDIIRESVLHVLNGTERNDDVRILVGRIAAFTQNAALLLAKKLEIEDEKEPVALERELTEGAKALIETLTRDDTPPTADQVRALFLSQIIPMLIEEALEPFRDEEGSDTIRLAVAPVIKGLFDAAQLASKSIDDEALRGDVQRKLDEVREEDIEPTLMERSERPFH